MLEADSQTSPDLPPFQVHLLEVFQRLRAAFTQALGAIGADPRRARELARLLGISRSLAWRVGRIATAVEPSDAVPHVPGRAAFEVFVKALTAADVPPSMVLAVRQAMSAYDKMAAVHSGDRSSLEQLAAGMTGKGGAAEHLEQGRRQAFLGMGSTWGVQAETQFRTCIRAPSNDRSEPRTDLAVLEGMIGLRRVRADARWTLFRHRSRMDDGSLMTAATDEAIDPQGLDNGLPLIRAHCSPSMPPLERIASGPETSFVLPAGPVGKTAAFHCVFGEIRRAIFPSVRSAENTEERLGCLMITPAERVQFDLIVSKELPWSHNPEVGLFSMLNGRGPTLVGPGGTNRLPLLEEVHELGWGTATMASPHVPGYVDLLQMAFERGGWDPEDFRGLRFTMRYPPIPTAVVFTSPLPEAG